MGFAAITRVTNEKWVACAVKDEISFGLLAGGELPLEATLCNEVRVNQETIVIDNVAKDEKYINLHIPKTYGFKSYISAPIIQKTNAFLEPCVPLIPVLAG